MRDKTQTFCRNIKIVKDEMVDIPSRLKNENYAGNPSDSLLLVCLVCEGWYQGGVGAHSVCVDSGGYNVCGVRWYVLA